MTRIFVYDNLGRGLREFPDPDPTMSPDEVRQSMTNFFPELANAEIKESKRTVDGVEQTVFEFRKRVGTKG